MVKQVLTHVLFFLMTFAFSGETLGTRLPPSVYFSTISTPDLRKLDFIDVEVQMVSTRRFAISFVNRKESHLFIKIYDIIGNLMSPPELITTKGKFRKEYDVPGEQTEFFLVEISNGRSSTIKKVRPKEYQALEKPAGRTADAQ